MIESRSLSLIRKAVDTFPANVAILEADGTIVHVNEQWRAFAREGGIAASEPMEGVNYLSAVDADDSESAVEAGEGIRAVLDGEVDSYEQVYPCHTPDEKHWFRMVVSGFVSDGDRYAAVVHVDITDRTQREHELELFESTFANQMGLAVMIDGEGELVVANERFYEITDTSPADMEGRHYRTLRSVLPADEGALDEIETLLTQVLDGGLDVGSTEVDFLVGGENTMTTDLRVIPTTVDEYTAGAVLTARDVTEWKKREKRLRQYERAVEGSTEMLSAVDADYNFLFANAAYREFHGIDDITGASLSDVLEGADLAQVQRHVDSVLDGERIEYSHKRMGPNGRQHPLSARYYPLRTIDGTISGAVAAMRDVSDKRDRDRQLLVLDRVLRHNMANEMNIVQGYAELLTDHDDPEVARYGEKIVSTAQRLVDSVEKEREIITLLSQSPQVEQFDIVNVANQVAESYELEYPDAEISVEGPASLHVTTIARIEQAIGELVENAIIHTSDPSVDIVVEDQDAVRVRVVDRGPGIPEEERGVLTGEQEIGPLYHGSGMGLWMVNWIVGRADGTLSFDSSGDDESAVVIDLPRQGGT